MDGIERKDGLNKMVTQTITEGHFCVTDFVMEFTNLCLELCLLDIRRCDCGVLLGGHRINERQPNRVGMDSERLETLFRKHGIQPWVCYGGGVFF